LRGSVGVAVAVLAAAALFNPLRRRVQAVVDRRFDRARYDAERVVTQFSASLRDEVDLDVLGAALLGVADQVLAPEHLTLWLSEVASGDLAGLPGRSALRRAGLRIIFHDSSADVRIRARRRCENSGIPRHAASQRRNVSDYAHKFEIINSIRLAERRSGEEVDQDNQTGT
jgi:hypothetical protein